MTHKLRWFEKFFDIRLVRHSFYTTTNELLYTATLSKGNEEKDYIQIEKFRTQTPNQIITFDDIDGTPVEATCHIEERDWRYGPTWLRKLGYSGNPIIEKHLIISFDKETGPKKGSWKGGVFSTMHPMKPGESLFTAFCNYAEPYSFTNIKYKIRE